MGSSVVGAPALRRATAERISFLTAKMGLTAQMCLTAKTGLTAQMGEQQPRDRLGRLVGHEVAHPRHDPNRKGPVTKSAVNRAAEGPTVASPSPQT